MNKFETTLLQTLSSIDESLKTLAGRQTAPAKPAAKKAPKPAKTAPKAGNGAMPKAVAVKAAKVPKAVEGKGKGKGKG